MTIKFSIKRRATILALGAESAGVFAVYKNGNIFISENFGDLLEENNFLKYKKAVLECLKREKIKPCVILTDLHPLFKTTAFGSELAKKYKIPHIKIQHHIAHIFSAVGDFMLNIQYPISNIQTKILNTKYIIPNIFAGIAMDGTGYGLDGNIWGGEIFKISNEKFQITNQIQNQKSKMKINRGNLYIERIGSLEEQIMIGGDLAVREPAKMVVAILAKLKIKNDKLKMTKKNLKIIRTKNDIYKFIKKFYTRNEFELLYNQLEQNFNCQKTTSTVRVLDAVSVLLGFAGNERKFKHEAVKLLEMNSSKPYDDCDLRFKIYDLRITLDTTHLFEYLLTNMKRDKKRLAATAQQYIANGFYEIIKKNHKSKIINHKSCVFAAGGMANNKIIAGYLGSHGVYMSKKIPRGDEGIAVGQVVYYLMTFN